MSSRSANCPILEGKPVLPSISIHDPGFKCCIYTPRRRSSPSALDPLYAYHQSQDGPYFSYRNNKYVTPNNILDPDVRRMFEHVVHLIDPCADNHQLGSDDFEVAVTIRCTSNKKPKWSYYIANHSRKTIRWGHARRFNDREELHDVGMRNVAEYWDHRRRYSSHYRCSQDDCQDLENLLDSVPVTTPGTPLSARGVEEFRGRLRQEVKDPASMQGTWAIGDIHARVLKAHLPEFYEPDMSFSKLLKSLTGLMGMRPQKFLHRRIHHSARGANSPTPSDSTGSTPEEPSSHPSAHIDSPAHAN
ncbi:hypothetical protein RhiJN_26011 [Ceratobasidium sp. AG-Ba]|nr:hypothetical protein RhiJN_26011 [Ceratobasidium sp. AG-Ba]